MSKKAFDCVEMQHEGGKRIYEAVKDMTFEQEVAYWRKRNASMRRWLKRKQAPQPAQSE
jgi:hypothetical protein